MPIIAVRKPKGPTSHDVVDMVRKITGESRVGHAGTLDPAAEGVLVIGVGKESTKQLHGIVGKEKEYIAEIYLGASSTTDDTEGIISPTADVRLVDKERIDKIVHGKKGRIMQTPPAHSAVKIGGKRAYKLARSNKAVQLEPRTVEIKKIEVLEYKWPILKLKIVTGPGFYVRALARDIGVELGTGGYLNSLVRSRVGEYRLEQAVYLDKLSKKEIYGAG